MLKCYNLYRLIRKDVFNMGGWIALVIVFIIILWIILTYNALVVLRNKVKNASAQIDTQLQRRFDLIPNLVETVKGYAEHEKGLLEEVTTLRSGYMNATTTSEKLAADNALSNTLKSLFAVSENYPDLKANTNFLQLQADLAETEDQVKYARQFYNDAVTMFNNKIQMFPNNIIAGIFNFNEEELFKTEDAAKEVPKVQF